MKKWHTLTTEEVLQELKSDQHQGLDASEVRQRQEEYGKNALPEPEPTPLWKVFILQFKSPLIYLLILAALAAFLMGESSDGFVILFVVTVNAFIGTLQEGRAERSMADLRKVSKICVNVIRDGDEKTINAEELVPGDIVSFNAGDAIAADMRLIDAFSLAVSEAVLTGESVPVEKSLEPVAEDASLGDRTNMLYSGTFITTGRAKAVVVATGQNTEIGEIAELTGNVEESLTPLQGRIKHFSQMLIYAAGILFVVITGVGLYQGHSMQEIVMIAISQVVSIVPEGLPVAMTVAAAVGVQRMARKKTIVRRLSAVETLGSTSVICSDKTGTLTLNKMSVTRVILPDKETLKWDEKLGEEKQKAEELFKIAVLCNDSRLEEDHGVGDPTESSLIAAAEKIDIKKRAYNKRFPRVGEIPFNSEAKLMATEHKGDGEHFIAIKGALDSVLELCSDIDESFKEEMREINESMAAEALRVLAFAMVPETSVNGEFDALKGKARFLGMVGQMDPPRKEASEAIKRCEEAGIRPVMITGDHKATGLAIARMIGLAKEGDKALEGKELEQLSTEKLAEEVNKVSVFARVHPSQKLKLVEAFQKAGHVVAMTGDGVNDAPALGKADVGVAMGITGTEVAKEASKIVITDDNFSTIVEAIAEGRLVYQNIKKLILLLFTTAIAEVAVLLIALLAGFASPYYAVQILWNNLVTEGVIAVNLIMDPAEGTELKRPPISRQEKLITPDMFKRLLVIAPAMILCTFGWYVYRLNQGLELDIVRTETLTLLVVCQWFNALNYRSETQTAFNRSLLKNKWLLGGLLVGNLLHVLVVYWRPMGNYFHTKPIDLEIVPIIALIGSIVLWVEEIRKFFVRRRISGTGHSQNQKSPRESLPASSSRRGHKRRWAH